VGNSPNRLSSSNGK
jgi:hypothetical protein